MEGETQTPRTAASVRYLAFEGGGGRGVAYSGAIGVLEDLGLLPITKTGSVDAISGASAGAITSFFISVGMIGSEIELEVKKNRFKDFFEDPYPGVYKGVKVHNGIAKVGYITDEYNIVSERDVPKSGLVSRILNNKYIDGITSGKNFYESKDFSKAKADGFKNYMKVTSLSTLHQVSPLSAQDLQDRLLHHFLKHPKDDIMRKLVEKKLNPEFYVASLLMDRGLFSGFTVREYFQEVAYRSLLKNFADNPEFVEIHAAGKKANPNRDREDWTDFSFINPILTFNKLKKLTGKELFVTSTNVTQTKPVVFCTSPALVNPSQSEWDTGDFPVIEAVICSMSIPFAFKPTYVNYFAPNGINYNGYYADGGMLYNTPIHIWDGGKDQPLNTKVLGIRVNDGYDPEDDTFKNDETWKTYFAEKFKEIPEKERPEKMKKYFEKVDLQQHPDQRTNSPSLFEYYYETPKGIMSTTLDLIGSLFSLIFYLPEQGQIRNEKEKSQTVLFYSYDVTMMDFNPSQLLKDFVAKRAKEKLMRYFGIQP